MRLPISTLMLFEKSTNILSHILFPHFLNLLNKFQPKQCIHRLLSVLLSCDFCFVTVIYGKKENEVIKWVKLRNSLFDSL